VSQLKQIFWKLEKGNYVIGKNPLVAIVEIGDYNLHLPPNLYGIKGKLFTPNLGIEKIIRKIVIKCRFF